MILEVMNISLEASSKAKISSKEGEITGNNWLDFSKSLQHATGKLPFYCNNEFGKEKKKGFHWCKSL